MDYQTTLQWMFDKLPMYQRIGGAAYKADVNNTITLLAHLGQPQTQFRSVHIAGTNGKGSVSHMLAAVFQEAGYKTGLYTSPHMKDFRERIRINGQLIEQDVVVNFINENREAFEQMGLSFFEMTVGMAFRYFADEKVDIAIIETGMGGRLDSTNLVTPELSIITNIGMDHMQFLGDTPEKIAAEKAGIIKTGITVVVGETQPAVARVFEAKAAEMQAPLVFADRLFDARRLDRGSDTSGNMQLFDVWKHSEPYLENLELELSGHYQQKNLVTALCAIDLMKAHFAIEEKHIREALAHVVQSTGLLGRWQQLGRNPLVIADAGHNIDGMREVVYQLLNLRYNQLHMVIGMVNDKNVESILQLLPRHATYYFCQASIPRAMQAEVLAAKAFEVGLRGEIYHSVNNAYKTALNNARFDDMVFIGGSTFVVAEVV